MGVTNMDVLSREAEWAGRLVSQAAIRNPVPGHLAFYEVVLLNPRLRLIHIPLPITPTANTGNKTT